MKIVLSYMPIWPLEFPQLGIANIYTSIKKSGHDVIMFDHNLSSFEYLKNSQDGTVFWNTDEINKVMNMDYVRDVFYPNISRHIKKFVLSIAKEQYTAIGFSVSQVNLNITQIVSSLIRKIYPEIYIFWGGPEIYQTNPTVCSNLEKNNINAAVCGAGENSVLRLIDCFEKKKSIENIPGVLTKNNIKMPETFISPVPADISKIHTTDFDCFDLTKYSTGMLPIQMSRGCVASCCFCSERAINPKYQIKTSAKMVNEIECLISKYNIYRYYFCDSLINGNHKILDEFCDMLIDKKMNIEWIAFARVNRKLTRTLLEKMYISGCRNLFFGFESGSQKILDLMRKGTQVKHAYEVIDNVYSVKIEICALMFIGFPFETKYNYQETVKFIYDHRKVFSYIHVGDSLSIAAPSKIDKDPQKYGILVDENNRPILDKNEDWTSSDGKLTPEIRKKRFLDMINLLKVTKIPSIHVNNQKDHKTTWDVIINIARKIFLFSKYRLLWKACKMLNHFREV